MSSKDLQQPLSTANMKVHTCTFWKRVHKCNFLMSGADRKPLIFKINKVEQEHRPWVIRFSPQALVPSQFYFLTFALMSRYWICPSADSSKALISLSPYFQVFFGPQTGRDQYSPNPGSDGFELMPKKVHVQHTCTGIPSASYTSGWLVHSR